VFLLAYKQDSPEDDSILSQSMMVLSFQVILNLKVMTLQKNGYSQIQTDLFNHNTICFEVKSFTFITKGGSEN